jgi:diguanylate cyclase (GGDEF)-like protein
VKQIPTIPGSAQSTHKLATLVQSHKNWQESPDVLTRLTRRLSTTLSLETQMGTLAHEINGVVPFDCMTYRHKIAARDFVYATGIGGPHRCDYRLNLEGQFYGALSFSRRKRFSEKELEGIELILSAAICPIRNACMYIAVEQAALTDSLTGIPNKRAMDDALTRAASLGDRHGQDFSLILCDLDRFKTINDEHGHVIGDHVLQLAAKELQKAIRNSDEVYRFGGEEFAVLLPQTSETEARAVSDRIRDFMASIRVNCGESMIAITTSCGIAMRLQHEETGQWLARADNALYRAKADGRNCTRVSATITKA